MDGGPWEALLRSKREEDDDQDVHIVVGGAPYCGPHALARELAVLGGTQSDEDDAQGAPRTKTEVYHKLATEQVANRFVRYRYASKELPYADQVPGNTDSSALMHLWSVSSPEAARKWLTRSLNGPCLHRAVCVIVVSARRTWEVEDQLDAWVTSFKSATHTITTDGWDEEDHRRARERVAGPFVRVSEMEAGWAAAAAARDTDARRPLDEGELTSAPLVPLVLVVTGTQLWARPGEQEDEAGVDEEGRGGGREEDVEEESFPPTTDVPEGDDGDDGSGSRQAESLSQRQIAFVLARLRRKCLALGATLVCLPDGERGPRRRLLRYLLHRADPTGTTLRSPGKAEFPLWEKPFSKTFVAAGVDSLNLIRDSSEFSPDDAISVHVRDPRQQGGAESGGREMAAATSALVRGEATAVEGVEEVRFIADAEWLAALSDATEAGRRGAAGAPVATLGAAVVQRESAPPASPPAEREKRKKADEGAGEGEGAGARPSLPRTRSRARQPEAGAAAGAGEEGGEVVAQQFFQSLMNKPKRGGKSKSGRKTRSAKQAQGE